MRLVAITTRREFLARSAGMAAALVAAGPSAAEDAGAAARGVLTNHVGFGPEAAKFCLLPGRDASAFEVVSTGTGRRVFRGRTTYRPGDLGDYSVGDFSAVRAPGTYRVRA